MQHQKIARLCRCYGLVITVAAGLVVAPAIAAPQQAAPQAATPEPAATAPAQAAPDAVEPPEPASAKVHVDAAKLLAGDDLTAVAEGYLCLSPKRSQAFTLPYVMPMISKTDTPLVAAAFDNLFYVGLRFVGSWVLQTSEGLILFDAMFNAGDARDIIEPGIRELGLDPANIKHIVITHGHFDHYGGVRYLQDKYQPRVWLSAADWDLVAADTIEAAPAGLRAYWPKLPPRRDAIVDDGSMLTLGDTTVQFVLTPGHTPGTVSAVIDVLDDKIKRAVTIWGGTAMPEDSAGVRQMHASLLKLWQAGQHANATAAISTHGFVEDSFGRFERKAAASGNPFNLGHDGYNRLMGIHSECILAQAARFEAWAR